VISERPTLVLERLDDKETVVEKKEMPLGGMQGIPQLQSNGYTQGFGLFTFSMANCTPGLWRMTVKGTAGEDKGPWTSEPRLLHLAPPPKPDQPNANPQAARITFDP
jgi:hypothetical protein